MHREPIAKMDSVLSGNFPLPPSSRHLVAILTLFGFACLRLVTAIEASDSTPILCLSDQVKPAQKLRLPSPCLWLGRCPQGEGFLQTKSDLPKSTLHRPTDSPRVTDDHS